MSVSEFTFLVLGLALGVASGVALIEIIRARPPAQREVRVTVAQDAVPRRRPATLADDAFVEVGPEPARGGPADRNWMDPVGPSVGPAGRTNVQADAVDVVAARAPRPGAIPVQPDPGRGVRIQPPEPAGSGGPRASLVGISISSGEDPALGALRASNATAAAATELAAAPQPARTAVALLEPTPAAPADPEPAPSATEPCAEARRVADERCEVATRARARADEAAQSFRAAQRTAEAHEAAAAEAAERGDPRAIRAAKEDAQRTFRAATRAATTPDAFEGAARDWLHEINRINTQTRDASTAVIRERAAASAFVETLERLSREADIARVAAEATDAACTAARTAVADCEERRTVQPAAVAPPAAFAPAPAAAVPDTREALGLALEGGGAPRVFRLLRGDQKAMATLVSALAKDDPEQAPHWLRLMMALLNAIQADAIEAAALEFPPEHSFWGRFNLLQARDVVRALASLGYRFDGRGGWVDDRVPTKRDLSLAVGYAGLDPMRIRQWPDEETTRALVVDVRVAADEYLAGNAGELTLGEMVTMLGRRADGLTDLWNHWGTIRPLLLQDA